MTAVTTQRTPGPLRTVGNGATHVDIYGADATGGPPICVRSSYAREDAAFIVQTWNAHDALVAVLTWIRDFCSANRSLSGDNIDEIARRADAALAKAREGVADAGR